MNKNYKRKTKKEIVEELSIHKVELEAQKEELLKNQEKLDNILKKYRSFYENIPVGIITIDRDFNIIDSNKFANENIFKVPYKIKNEKITKYISNDFQDIFYIEIRNIINQNKANSTFSLQFNRDDKYYQINAYISIDDPDLIQLTISDITETICNKNFLNNLIDSLNIGILVIDSMFKIKFCNKKLKEIFNLDNYFPDEKFEKIFDKGFNDKEKLDEKILKNEQNKKQNCLENQKKAEKKENQNNELEGKSFFEIRKLNFLSSYLESFTGTFFSKKLSNNNFVYNLTITKLEDYYLFTIEDITEKEYAQNLLVEKDKMELLTNLTVGIAHELNNPLGAILQSLQNTSRRLDRENQKNIEEAKKIGINFDDLYKYLKERNILFYLDGIKSSANRMSNIIKNILSFVNKGSDVFEDVEINQVINEAFQTVLNDFYLTENCSDLKYFIDLKPYINTLYLIKSDIKIAFINIFKNCFDAIKKHKYQGENFPQIIIKNDLDEKYYIFDIFDNGVPLSENDIRKISMPFYYSERNEDGINFTLTYFIVVNKHNGKLIIERKDGMNHFSVRLPKYKK